MVWEIMSIRVSCFVLKNRKCWFRFSIGVYGRKGASNSNTLNNQLPMYVLSCDILKFPGLHGSGKNFAETHACPDIEEMQVHVPTRHAYIIQKQKEKNVTDMYLTTPKLISVHAT